MLSKAPTAYSVLPASNFEHRFKMPAGYSVPFLREQNKRHEWKSNGYLMRERAFSLKLE